MLIWKYSCWASFKDLKTGHFEKPFTPSHPAEGNAQERRAHVRLQPKRLYCHLSPGRGLPRRRGSGGQGRAPSVGVWRATCWCQCPDVGMLRLSTMLLAFSAQEAATLSCSSHIVSILFFALCAQVGQLQNLIPPGSSQSSVLRWFLPAFTTC